MANIFCIVAEESKDLVQHLTDIQVSEHKLIICICSLEKVAMLYSGKEVAEFADLLLIDGSLIVDEETKSFAECLVTSFKQSAPLGTVLEWSSHPIGLCEQWQDKQVTAEGVLTLMEHISRIAA